MATFLDVPFAEKDQAKQKGAQWDSSVKKWFVPHRSSLFPFARWLQDEAFEFNDVSCDIYLGNKAGKRISKDLEDATNEVLIVSPYVSTETVSQLVDKHRKGVSVKLVTTDMDRQFRTKEGYVYDLIRREEVRDEKAARDLKRFVGGRNLSRYSAVLLLVLFVVLSLFLKNHITLLFTGILLAVAATCVSFVYERMASKVSVHSYVYRKLFPFRVYRHHRFSSETEFLVHSKIFIFDEKVAYLGSSNLTYNGFLKNYESTIRTTDRAFIQKLRQEVDRLYNHHRLQDKDVQFWGETIYAEREIERMKSGQKRAF